MWVWGDDGTGDGDDGNNNDGNDDDVVNDNIDNNESGDSVKHSYSIDDKENVMVITIPTTK